MRCFSYSVLQITDKPPSMIFSKFSFSTCISEAIFFRACVIPAILAVRGKVNKHFMIGSKGNSEFCFPDTLNVGWRGDKTHCFAWGQLLSVLLYLQTQKIERIMYKLYTNHFLDAGWHTSLPRFQGARRDHVRVESSSVVSVGS